eukprot:CAMPEP_0114557884 /NCGR_PEP_ID=MMETSP0114-20121206/10073_1 /TAXON_ID=31324 /ORGANISM="Goniomonas sp, Strain m" /LENGTH=76 /DNA_ID=CAMNT_0001743211 /DNA_START=33 /DNA_END=259 /DNA_ORIENTATION=-
MLLRCLVATLHVVAGGLGVRVDHSVGREAVGILGLGPRVDGVGNTETTGLELLELNCDREHLRGVSLGVHSIGQAP